MGSTRKPRRHRALWLITATATVVLSGCTDRAESQRDVPSPRIEELCTQRCTMPEDCGRDPLSDDELADCVDSCTDRHSIETCTRLSEEMLEVCNEIYVETCAGQDAAECQTAKIRWNACRGNPEYWAQHDCYDKCPGECCVNADFPD